MRRNRRDLDPAAKERALDALARSRRQGLSLTRASRLSGTTLRTVLRHVPSGFRKDGRRYRPTTFDRIPREMTVALLRVQEQPPSRRGHRQGSLQRRVVGDDDDVRWRLPRLESQTRASQGCLLEFGCERTDRFQQFVLVFDGSEHRSDGLREIREPRSPRNRRGRARRHGAFAPLDPDIENGHQLAIVTDYRRVTLGPGVRGVVVVHVDKDEVASRARR